MEDITHGTLYNRYETLCKAHILATRHNVELEAIIKEKDKLIEMQREAIREFMARDIYSVM